MDKTLIWSVALGLKQAAQEGCLQDILLMTVQEIDRIPIKDPGHEIALAYAKTSLRHCAQNFQDIADRGNI